MIRLYIIVVILGFFVSCSTSSTVINEESGKDIFLADPAIFYHEGSYYLYGTGSPRGFLVYTSDDLKSWEGPKGMNEGFALRKGEAFGEKGFWAPQIFFYENKFYMAYTANESIAIAESNSPLGPFKQERKAPLAAPVKQIDPFVFIDDDGKKYLYHVRVANRGNRIFVAEMQDDFSGIKEETLKECITATESWENIENARWSVTEGPSVLKHNGLYYLIYSANHYKSKDYAVGYATSTSPYGPWKKYSGSPILSRAEVNQPGAGHGDFFRTRDNELYYVFHTHHSDSTIGPRRTALVEMNFTKTGDNDQLKIKSKSFRYLKTK